MDKLKTYLRFFLPALFILYAGSLIAFTHVHIVDGVTIVHSHPYAKNDKGSAADHSHSLAIFQLLHQLSVVETGDPQIGSIEIIHGEQFLYLLKTEQPAPAYSQPGTASPSLRAPPHC